MLLDKEVSSLIEQEKKRQLDGVELIASENFTSSQVMSVTGSILTNKYAEGYPGKRYYGGCEVVDEIENIAIEKAKVLFGAEYANVQPHSGSQANAAVFHAFLKSKTVANSRQKARTSRKWAPNQHFGAIVFFVWNDI